MRAGAAQGRFTSGAGASGNRSLGPARCRDARRQGRRTGGRNSFHHVPERCGPVCCRARGELAQREARPTMAQHADDLRVPAHWSAACGRRGNPHILAVLELIWRAKPETAVRLRGRVESVLDYARARGWREGENPARWRGHLSQMLPARGKIAPVKHHAALPWKEIGTFMAALRNERGVGAQALQFAILTAGRSGEVRGRPGMK